MFRSTITCTVLAFAMLGLPEDQHSPALHFTQETMIIEYSATLGEAEIVFEAEAEEALDHVEILAPDGKPLLRLQTRSGQGVSLSGLRLEGGESSLASLLARYPEGVYPLRARSTSGRLVQGSAELSQQLLAAPVIVHPLAGQAAVVANNLVINWIPDPQAAGYTIDLEQDENDGLKVKLPAGTNSFQVPAGVLAPHKPTRLEIQAIAANGNRTLTEIRFSTL